MPFRVPEYPPILTPESWKVQRGDVAHITGETGIGDLMRKCQLAFAEVDWPSFDLARDGVGPRNSRELHLAHAAALAQRRNLQALDRAALALENMARRLAQSWKANPAVPAASAAHAAAVFQAAADFNAMANFGAVLAALDAQHREWAEQLGTRPGTLYDSDASKF